MRDGLAAALAQLIERDGAGRLAGEQNPLGDRRFIETIERFRIFDEYGLRVAGLNGTDDFLRRISGIEGCGDGTVGHDAQVSQVEFQARLGIERDDITLTDAQRAQARGDLFGGGAVFGPTYSAEQALTVFGIGLVKRRCASVQFSGFFKDAEDGAVGHRQNAGTR